METGKNEVVLSGRNDTQLAEPTQPAHVSSQIISDFADAMRIGKVFAASGLVPSAYAGKAGDCAIAVDMAQRMGVPPLMVMQQLYVVKGKPSWSGQACLSFMQMVLSRLDTAGGAEQPQGETVLQANIWLGNDLLAKKLAKLQKINDYRSGGLA